MRTYLIIIAIILSIFSGCERDNAGNSTKVNVDVTLDAGFVAQQHAIIGKINQIRDSLEWKYNKGNVITKNIIVGAIVIAVVAGVVIGSGGKGLNLGGGGDSSEYHGPSHIKLVYGNSDCKIKYYESSDKIGMTNYEFNVPPDTEIFIFHEIEDVQYSLGYFKSGKSNTEMKIYLNLVTASLQVIEK